MSLLAVPCMTERQQEHKKLTVEGKSSPSTESVSDQRGIFSLLSSHILFCRCSWSRCKPVALEGVLVALAALLWLAPRPGFAATAELFGYVVSLDDNDQEQRLKGVTVSLAAGGGSDVSRDDGSFHITLPRKLGSGSKVIFHTDKSGWVIFNPLGG